MDRIKAEPYPFTAREIIDEIIHFMTQGNWEACYTLRMKYERLHGKNYADVFSRTEWEIRKIIEIVDREYFLRYGN